MRDITIKFEWPPLLRVNVVFSFQKLVALARTRDCIVYVLTFAFCLLLFYLWLTMRHTFSWWSVIQFGDTALFAPLSPYPANGTIFRRKRLQNYDAELYGCFPRHDEVAVDLAMNELMITMNEEMTMNRPVDDSQCVCSQSGRRRVFILGLPKAGTGSLHRMFENMGCKSWHWQCGHTVEARQNCSESIVRMIESDFEIDHNEFELSESSRGSLVYLGFAMEFAHRHNRSLLRYVPPSINVYAQMDVVEKEPGLNIWPQLSYFRLLLEQYPDALFILNYRDLDRHIRSINNWKDLRARIIWNDVPGLPRGRGWRDTELKEWILTQYCDVERFFMANAPHSFLKYDIERDTVLKLEHFLQCSNITVPHSHNTKELCQGKWTCSHKFV